MSFRDLRNFTEMMRSLGYPRLISMENFRMPNFALVAEVLIWLVQRYDPNVDLPLEVDTEQDRIIFIKSVVQFMAIKAHIKLNTKKLYMADGYAVKELLKVTSMLYNAMKDNSTISESYSFEESVPLNFDLSTKLNDLKTARMLASEITTRGATLYDLLAKEVELREFRSAVLSKPLEVSEVEKNLLVYIESVEEEIKKTHHLIESVASDEANLEAKIEKKKAELDRNQKRLHTLQSVRPAFMDEYEKLEEDLEKVYESYIDKFRNLTFLEQQLDEYNRTEQEKMEETEVSMKKLLEKMQRDEELMAVHGDLEDDDDLEDLASLDTSTIPIDHLNRQRRPPARQNNGRAARPPRAVGPGGARVFGSMIGEGSDNDSDSLGLGSGSELDLDDEEEHGLEDRESDEELEAPRVTDRRVLSESKTELHDSDNDF